MAKHRYILLTTSIIGGIVFLYCGKIYYENKREELCEKARSAFNKALEQEFEKRDVKEKISFIIKLEGQSNIRETPDTIYWEDENGKRKYILQPERHRKNVVVDPNTRFIHSYVLMKSPIISDTLNGIWQKYLKENGIFCKSGLQIDVYDRDEQVITSLTSDNNWFKTPIVDYTIGYRCEVEIKGYLNYGINNLIGVRGLGFFLLYCLFIGGAYKVVIYINKRVNQPPVVTIKEVPMIELVKDTDKSPVRSYRLGNNSIFYAEQKKIVSDGEERKISPQIGMLLEYFLNATDYKLSDDEIMKYLWPDDSGSAGRIQQAIARLRNVLEVEPQIHIERIGISAYQMFI